MAKISQFGLWRVVYDGGWGLGRFIGKGWAPGLVSWCRGGADRGGWIIGAEADYKKVVPGFEEDQL